MEPLNKTEQDFKSKLDARELTPSAAAWDRLDAMLAVAEQKKAKRSYGWLYIAAGILGFLTIGAVFFSQTETVIDARREVVFDENRVNVNPRSDQTPGEESPKATASVASVQIRTSAPKSGIATNSIINQKSVINQDRMQTDALAVVQHGELALENRVAPTSSTAESKSVIVTADALLAAVQAEQTRPKTSVKVDAKSLLHEADRSVNLSFRDKMLRRASEVAEAVVTRNHE